MKDPAPFTRWACDVMEPNCPARAVLGVLADKWTLLILQALSEGDRRPGELRRRIGGVSEKVLHQTLKRLEEFGLVTHIDHQVKPMRVDYRLTERGRSLSPIVLAFDRWIETHAPDILPPSSAYDLDIG